MACNYIPVTVVVHVLYLLDYQQFQILLKTVLLLLLLEYFHLKLLDELVCVAYIHFKRCNPAGH